VNVLPEAKFSPDIKYLPEGDTYVFSMNLMNWDEKREEDIKNGIGFDLTDYEPLVKNKATKEKKRAINGIYSSKFGSDLSDDVTVSDRYSCTCKELKGAFNEGEICPKCKTPVIYFNSDILKTGWFGVEAFSFIQPHFYEFLANFIGPKRLNNILLKELDTDKNGMLVKFEREEKDSDKTPFDKIGLVEFQERFDEIMEFYNNPKKEDLYQFILKNRDKIFIKHIPVYSLNLRPFVMRKNNVRYADINKKLTVLSVNIGKLNKKDEYTHIEKEKLAPLLYDTQVIINTIYKMNMDMMVGKEGHIRSKMVSAKVNFSARCVIIPSATPIKMNMIRMPYMAFLEVFKFRIINILTTVDHMTIAEAEDRWFQATIDYDEKVYQIMQMLVEKSNNGRGLYVYLNRMNSAA